MGTIRHPLQDGRAWLQAQVVKIPVSGETSWRCLPTRRTLFIAPEVSYRSRELDKDPELSGYTVHALKGASKSEPNLCPRNSVSLFQTSCKMSSRVSFRPEPACHAAIIYF